VIDAQRAIQARGRHPNGQATTLAPTDIEQAIPRLIERQARATPDHPALASTGTTWSYAELDARANRVAHAVLDRRGPGPEPVALLLEHGAALVAAILGVLKAGKAYVPIDPALHVVPEREKCRQPVPKGQLGHSLSRGDVVPEAEHDNGLRVLASHSRKGVL